MIVNSFIVNNKKLKKNKYYDVRIYRYYRSTVKKRITSNYDWTMVQNGVRKVPVQESKGLLHTFRNYCKKSTVVVHDVILETYIFFEKIIRSFFSPIFDTIHLHGIVSYIKMAKHRILSGFAAPILCFQDALLCFGKHR